MAKRVKKEMEVSAPPTQVEPFVGTVLDIDPSDRDDAIAMMNYLAQIKSQFGRLKTEIERINGELIPILVAYNLKAVEYMEVRYSVINSCSVTVNSDALRVSMLSHGIDPDIVSETILEATRRTPYTTMQVKGNKNAD